MVDAPGFDDPGAFRNRIIYDLTFFIVLGVLLFDIVSGIILDEFGAIREEVNDRADKMANETFISGIARDRIEEMEGNTVQFDVINDVNQEKWSYLFFMIYLSKKGFPDCNGCEAFVKKCIEDDDTSWVPQRTCLTMERAGLSENEEKTAEELMGEQSSKIDTLEKSITGLMKKYDDEMGGGGT